VTLSSLPRLWEQGAPREGEDDCGRSGYNIMHHDPLYQNSLVRFTYNFKNTVSVKSVCTYRIQDIS
jgi:hypothetical protein